MCRTELHPGGGGPARAAEGKGTNPSAIQTGAWRRLKAGTSTTGLTGQARPIAEALKTHGAVLTDTCGQKFALMGENSTAWNDAELAQLGQLTAADFEVVDTADMMVSDHSWVLHLVCPIYLTDAPHDLYRYTSWVLSVSLQNNRPY